MDSVDIGHVPPPNPDCFWDFTINQSRVLIDFNTSIRLIGLCERAAQFSMSIVDKGTVEDWLKSDRPCVALRFPSGEPYVTLTLRKLEGSKAYLQVTANPKASIGTRTNLDA